MALTFPPFVIGYRFYWRLHGHFVLRLPPSLFDEIAGQVVVIALPEEAFFRGYLQTSIERVFPPRRRILGAELGVGWILAAAIFAVGHVLTIRHPARLAVFFPALVFGWMRRRTGGVGASVLFHASCNLFSAALGRGFGLMP
jgi:membrane protease YdiL (CAAX protease family)